MKLFKNVPVAICLLAIACVTRAEKKIELQDIEEDNLKSEKEKDQISTARNQNVDGTGRDLLPLEFLKNGLLRYFESPQVPQQPRYVHQYAVNEPPEKQQNIAQQQASPKGQYAASAPQQAMVGYLSNVPMQIYLVPQYYGEQTEQSANVQQGVQYAAPAVPRGYPTGPEVAQPQSNYIEVPSYGAPSGKAYVAPQYTPQITYVTYAPQPTIAPNHIAVVTPGPSAPQATVAPMLTYAMPLVQYPTSIYTKPYYPNYGQTSESNTIEEVQEGDIESSKHYGPPSEMSYNKPSAPEFPRYYTSRAPIREEQRHHPVQELPPPSPLIYRSQPSHLAGLPKALPMFRPLNKPVYSAPGNLIPGIFPRPNEAYGYPKRRPTSLLDSYIPSSVQLEYLKRGYAKDPLAIYDALSGRGFPHVSPKHFERGFLPNQMYHTAAGGVTYGHYKRTPKSDKAILKA